MQACCSYVSQCWDMRCCPRHPSELIAATLCLGCLNWLLRSDTCVSRHEVQSGVNLHVSVYFPGSKHVTAESPLLNALQLVREKLEDVGPDMRMVESLAPMWDEERQRCGGTGPPPPPPDPPRDPQLLCRTVEDERAKFQVTFLVT